MSGPEALRVLPPPVVANGVRGDAGSHVDDAVGQPAVCVPLEAGQIFVVGQEDAVARFDVRDDVRGGVVHAFSGPSIEIGVADRNGSEQRDSGDAGYDRVSGQRENPSTGEKRHRWQHGQEVARIGQRVGERREDAAANGSHAHDSTSTFGQARDGSSRSAATARTDPHTAKPPTTARASSVPRPATWRRRPRPRPRVLAATPPSSPGRRRPR